MSTIIRFFLAPDDDTAAAAAEGGPAEDADSVTYGNFDVWGSIEEWENLLTGRAIEDVEGPDSLGDGDGAHVLAFPPALTAALAAGSVAGSAAGTAAGTAAGGVAGVAARWVSMRAEEREHIDEELAEEIVGEVAALAVRAARTGMRLYCWVC